MLVYRVIYFREWAIYWAIVTKDNTKVQMATLLTIPKSHAAERKKKKGHIFILSSCHHHTEIWCVKIYQTRPRGPPRRN